ncbi:MAG TPA: hypothetical protein VFD12_06545 [Oligella sp.]|nr:hypothetical protein [Oligella sp.]
MAVNELARRCLQGGLLRYARNDGVEFAMTRFCLCEERSDVAVHG